MSQIDRQLEKQFEQLFKEWCPGRIQFWNYTPHKSQLTLKLSREDQQGYLKIVATGITDLQCEASWDASAIAIFENCSGWLLTDYRALHQVHYIIQAEAFEVHVVPSDDKLTNAN